MFVKSLSVSNYRNLKDQQIIFSPGTNIIIGNNGQGKSNILEAVNFILSGKSFRSFEREYLINHNQPNCFIGASISKDELEYQIKIGIDAQKYHVEINNKKKNLSNLRNLFSLIVFSPDSLSVIKEAAQERRNLVDDFLETLGAPLFNLISDFRKLLRQRNKVLKDLSKEFDEGNLAVLESLNELFIPQAAQLSALRIKHLRILVPMAQDILNNIHPNPVKIDFQYLVSGENMAEKTPEFLLETITKRHNELRNAELKYGSSLVGPQRHDLRFFFDLQDSRFFSSQGQQRSIILALKMAQIVYHKQINGIYPILILDDVLSELDKTRSEALISFVQQLGTQIFISSTDVTLPRSFSANQTLVAKVENGQIYNLERTT